MTKPFLPRSSEVARLTQRNIPEKIPKSRKHDEADLTPAIMNWFDKNYDHENNVAVEIKITGGKVKPHQFSALIQIIKGIFKWKPADKKVLNPFDFILLRKCDAYIVWADKETKKCVAKCPLTNETKFEFYL